MKKRLLPLFGLMLINPLTTHADVSRECRGVAAGIVSAMKANDEIANEEMMLVAVKAARRSCAAALEGFSDDYVEETGNVDTNGDGKMSTWELLTQDQEKKKGNKRLERLRN